MALAILMLTGCAQTPAPPTTAAAPGARPPAATPTPASPASPASPAAPAQPAAPVLLAEPLAARTWDEFQRQAALRMVAASPEGSYVGTPPDPLLAIPVLEIELERDGRVRDIRVLRYPKQALDTTKLAVEAVRRAAPYGDMTHLSRPWKFTEVFLFNDERRFMPRTLDE
jgi:outer membrane biosynthesis protein TonB